ncbi:hypothetical protein [Salinigranum sp. GCM10025319]|uniref:hypothetical protein n=1 Tax=Salinigranum sp. GCM10025319 TaxID=3252687 RepID=UPI00361E33C4
MPSSRTVAASLLFGVVHAAVLLLVAIDLGYSVGPGEYSLVGTAWRYGGLVVVAALPAWLALRYTLVTPLCALVVTSGYVLAVELLPPGPTFRDVAELERLSEPTEIMVVENGLYVVRYMLDAAVWTVGFLFLGAVEYVVRTTWSRLPSIPRPARWASVPASRRRATIIAAVGGLLHAGAMVRFAVRLGVTASGGFESLLFAFGVVGMWLLAAVPLYLLVRHRLVAPASLLAAFVLLDARSGFVAGVDSPHVLYFGGWFVFLTIVLIAAGVELALRRLAVFDHVSLSG